VALHPPEANHHLRTDFTINDLDSWWNAHRGEVLAAILTIARGWVVAGRPTVVSRSDDFARWVDGLRGLMAWAGFKGLFGGSSTEVAMSTDDEEWQAFLEALFRVFAEKPFTVKSVVERLHDDREGGLGRKRAIDPAMLPGDLAQQWSHIRDGRDQGFRKSLGWWLRNRVGRYAAGWSLVADGEDTKTKVARYVVKPPAESSPGSAAA
jgi:hypothetical protein